VATIGARLTVFVEEPGGQHTTVTLHGDGHITAAWVDPTPPPHLIHTLLQLAAFAGAFAVHCGIVPSLELLRVTE